MALTRASKTEKVARLAAELEHSTSAIIGTFKGLTASKDFELRKTIRSAGGSYHVVKNKLAARAGEGTKVEQALKGLKGVSAVAYTSGDPVALAKALSTWVKDNAEFTFKLGIIDGKVINVAEIGDLATMPGKEELFSKLLFLINSPAQRLATVINATGRDLAVVINQGVEKGKFAGSAAPAVEAKAEVAEAPVAEAPAAVAEVPVAAPEAVAEAPAAEASAVEAVAHIEESAAGEQPSGAAQPENSTASQGGEAAGTDPVEGN
ncbi:MAG: 50S ribosomal protein L10 [Edaphobacter sp.]